MKMVLDIISALTSLGIVGFLIYFFIYYRTSMKSVLDAIGDTDSLKAGSWEFKRRKQLDESVKTIKSEPESETLSKQELLEYHKQYIVMCNYVLFVLASKEGPKNKATIQSIRDNRNKLFKYVCLSDPNYFSETTLKDNSDMDFYVEPHT